MSSDVYFAAWQEPEWRDRVLDRREPPIADPPPSMRDGGSCCSWCPGWKTGRCCQPYHRALPPEPRVVYVNKPRRRWWRRAKECEG